MVALFIWTDNVYEPPLWVEFVIWVPVTVLMCLALLPFMKGVAVGLCWAMNIVRQGVRRRDLQRNRPAGPQVPGDQRPSADKHDCVRQLVQLFLTFSLVAAIAFLVTGEHRQGLRGLALQYGVPIACLMLHAIALAGILIFRHYVTAAHRKLDEIVKLLGDTGGSPVPVRFTLWMTHLMAAGFVVSYLRMVLVALASTRLMAIGPRRRLQLNWLGE